MLIVNEYLETLQQEQILSRLRYVHEFYFGWQCHEILKAKLVSDCR